MTKSDKQDIAGALVTSYGWEEARETVTEMVTAWSRSASADADEGVEKWRQVLAQLDTLAKKSA